MNTPRPTPPAPNRISLDQEYQVLHDVARALQTAQDTPSMLQQGMHILTGR